MFHSLRTLHIDGCHCLDHRRKRLFEDVAFREWDELSISRSQTVSLNQEFCFLLPVGSINDPLLLEQLQCHGYGDPCENGTIKLHVRHEDMANYRVILETTYEVHCDNSMYMDDVQDHCYTINFGRSDKINEVPRGKTIIMKVRPANNFEITKVDVKVQKRSKFSDENMKTFISISRRDFQNELSIFFSLQEADELHAIKYSTRIEKHKDDMYTQLNVPCGERRLLFDWSIEELLILTMIFGDMETSWYEQRHGTGLPRQETAKEAAFHDLQAFSISSRRNRHAMKAISLPFPRGGRMRSEPLQLEKMSVLVERKSVEEVIDARVAYVGVALGSRIFQAAPAQIALELREDLEAQQEQAPDRRYFRSYTGRFGKDDETNRRLRVEATSSDDAIPVTALHISCQDPMSLPRGADIWGMFEMHDQIRDMGREIVLRESLLHSGLRSRLWCVGDAVDALTRFQENKIEGIILNLCEGSEIEFRTEAFALMSELRILLVNFASSGDCDFRHLPASLKWLEWKGCLLESLPFESKFKSIVVLNLSRSFISQLWSKTTIGSGSKSTKEVFGRLKVLDLSCCHCLNATPDFAMAPNLVKLILDECSNLKEVDDSIEFLKKLVFLSMRECVSLEKLPNKIHELSSLVVLILEGCIRLVAFPQFPPRSSTNGLSNLKELILRDCESLEFLPQVHEFQSLRSLYIDGCQGLDHRRKHLFEDVVFSEWDELSIAGSQTLSWEQEFSFMLPIGSINDPLLLQQLQCHGYGDSYKSRTMILRVCHEDIINGWVVLETVHEAHCDDSIYEDGVYGYCYTINFGTNDKINEAPRGKTIIMKVTTSYNSKLTKVDVKLQKRSKFTGENMKPLINISRRDTFMNTPTSVQPSSPMKAELEFAIFFNLCEEDKLHNIKYLSGLDDRIANMLRQLDVYYTVNKEPMLLFGWTIEELIILTLIFSDINVSWYEVFDKLKVLDLSHCKFLVTTPDFGRTPQLDMLILDHCECLLEIGESIGLLKNLIFLSIVGCAKLHVLPCGILQLSSLKLLSLEKCSEIKILPEANITDVSLESLQELILDGCTSLSGLPEYVGRFRSLRRLSLRGCPSLDQLPDSIGNLVVLEELILDDCPSLASLPDSIGNLKSLYRLSVFRNNYNCRVVRIPYSIGKLKSLKEFICKNALIPNSIQTLESLLQLSLVECEMSNQPGSRTCQALCCMDPMKFTGNMKNLQYLTLNGSSIPISVGSMKCLKELALIGPRVRQLPKSIGHFKNLSCITLERCIYVQRLPGSVKRMKSLRVLCLDDCRSLECIPQLPSGLIKMQATNCQLLCSTSDVSNLMALKELNVGGCKKLVNIPGLQNLRSLKVLHMNGCGQLDLDSIRLQLEEATFHDLEAFSICKEYEDNVVNTVSLPFPRGGRMGREPLYVEKIIASGDQPEFVPSRLLEIKVSKDSVLYVDAVDVGTYKNSYTASFKKEDEINEHLRVKAASTDESNGVEMLCVSSSLPFSLRRVDAWFRQSFTPEPDDDLATSMM
ncbi:popC protein [Nymphaea thermarum]|nr:popC protein [Nymphaea thermarum]